MLQRIVVVLALGGLAVGCNCRPQPRDGGKDAGIGDAGLSIDAGTVGPWVDAGPGWHLGSSLRAANVTQTSLTLVWTAPQDPLQITGYDLTENGSSFRWGTSSILPEA